MARSTDKRTPTRSESLRPVQDVIGRIRFDAALDVAHFTVGYEERFAGVREAPLAGLLGEGEVPWHRIWFIKAGALVVWDRRARIDLILGSGVSHKPDLAAVQRACVAPGSVQQPPTRRGRGAQSAARFVPQPCLRFDASRETWVASAATGPASAAPESLQVITYNVLFDLYEAEHIYSARRRAACIELLRSRDADIIALQEVTPVLWAQLLASPWVRAGYYVSTGADAAGLAPYGQVLLSRWPLTLESHAFSAEKKLLVARLLFTDRTLSIATTHLTSNQKPGAADKRAEQLAVIAAWLAREPGDALVLGDFNFGDGDENTRLVAAGLTDAWQTVHPHHPGFTFDPVANPLAALMTHTGQAARYDRVLLRSPAGNLAPIEVTMFGERPFADGMFTSDHFGLCCLLQTASAPVDPRHAALARATPVHRSALVVLPPTSLWPAIDVIRAAHDPSHARWMPHINLLYGFVSEEFFTEAAEVVAAIVRRFGPFVIHLRALGRFDHRGSTTVWLAPVSEPAGALEALQAALAASFPGCDEQAARGSGFTPHLTIARLTGDEAQIAATIGEWQARWRACELRIDAVHLISRRDDEPFVVRHSAPLGRTVVVPPTAPGVAAWPAWSVLPSPAHVRALEAVARACVAVLGTDAAVHVVGSARLGVASAETDLDLVCAGPDHHDRSALFTAVHERLVAEGLWVGGREVAGAGLTLLRCEIDGVAVDLQYAGLPAPLIGRGLPALDAAALAQLDEVSRRAALGCIDADALMRVATQHSEPAVFQAMLSRVRAWARARQLDGGAWGLLGGYSWALLAAAVARESRERDPEALLRLFFTTMTAWPPGRPVTFTDGGAAPSTRPAPWPIYTVTPPCFNSARGLTRSTHALLRAELARGAALLAGDASMLCAAIEAPTRRIVLTLRAEDEEALAAGAGWLDGRVLGLLLALERSGATVRPYPRPHRIADGLEYSVGVEGGGAGLISAAHSFVAEVTTWIGRPPGLTLSAALVQR